MQNNEETYLSPNWIAYVVRKTAQQCYGIVGLASPNGVTLLSHILPPFLNKNGVEVMKTSNGYKINVYVVVEYGTTFNVICENLCVMIKYNLKVNFGIQTDGIKIFVKGVRKSN